MGKYGDEKYVDLYKSILKLIKEKNVGVNLAKIALQECIDVLDDCLTTGNMNVE